MATHQTNPPIVRSTNRPVNPRRDRGRDAPAPGKPKASGGEPEAKASGLPDIAAPDEGFPRPPLR